VEKYQVLSPLHLLYLVADADAVQISYVVVIEFGDFKFGGVGFEIALYDNCVLLLAPQCPMVRLVPVIPTVFVAI